MFKDYNKDLKRLILQVRTSLLQKQTTEATEQIVEFIKNHYTVKSIRDDNDSEVWFYNDGIYIKNGKSYIKEICRKTLQEGYTTYLCNQVISKIETDTFVEKELFFDQQADYPHILAVKNGLLNLYTKEIKMFDENLYQFAKINYDYDPNAECPKILNFIKLIVDKEEDVLTIQEIFGFSLFKQYKFQKGFMLYGAHGRNGKTILIKILKLLLGSENCSSVTLQNLEKERFELYNLHNKLVNECADLSPDAIKNTGRYKSLTGMDTVTADRKNQSHVSFVNYAKMIFACNEMPMIQTYSDAFWLRWVIIEFNKRFLPENELKFHKGENVFKQDPQILNKITTPEEMKGLLNWAVEGFQRLNAQGYFSNEKSSNKVKKFWLRKSNSVKAFIEDHVEFSYDSHVCKDVFQTQYFEYCKRHNIKQLSPKAIKITLEQELGSTTKQMVDRHDNQTTSFRVWTGIKLKEDLLRFNPDTVLNYISKFTNGISYSSLSDKFPDKDIDYNLKLLQRQGDIYENPKGVWKKV